MSANAKMKNKVGRSARAEGINNERAGSCVVSTFRLPRYFQGFALPTAHGADVIHPRWPNDFLWSMGLNIYLGGEPG